MLALIAAIVALNFIVDPYIVYRKVLAPGFNDIKPRAQQQGTLSKRAGIAQLRPHALVLGNSRAEIGFDPAHRAWPGTAQPVFNAALPGTGLASSIDMLRDALQINKPAVAIVGIEFNDFLTDPAAKTPPAPQPAHTPTTIAAVKRRARDVTTTLLSLDALTDALLTLKAQFDPNAATLRADGFNPMRDYAAIARREGYHALFLQRDMEYARTYAKAPRNLFIGNSGTSADFEALKALLRFARSNGIELKLVIYPYHAHFLDIMQASGLWPVFEQWKRALVEIVAQEAMVSGATPYALWDFSGHHAYASEAVPHADDKQHIVRWYWEAGHFKKELGDLMLDRVFGLPPQPDAASFGVIISRENVEQHLAALRTQAQHYARANPTEQAYVAKLTQRPQRSGSSIKIN